MGGYPPLSKKINKKLELEVIALHLEQRASWHWFTKAYPISDPLSFERDVSSPCQKCTLHIPRKPLTGPTVILFKPAWTCFFSFFPLFPLIFFPLQERTQKPIKKIKIKHFSLYQDLHCKPLYSSSYAKRKRKTITVILQKRLVKKSERWIVHNISSPFVCKSIWWWLEDQLSKNKTDILLAVKQQL